MKLEGTEMFRWIHELFEELIYYVLYGCFFFSFFFQGRLFDIFDWLICCIF